MSGTEALLKEENEQLRQQVKILEEKVASFVTARNQAQRTYYKKHTELAQQRTKTYLDKLKETDPERLAAYRHQAYVNRKEKMQAQKEKEKEKEEQD